MSKEKRFAGLSNEELVLVYDRFNDYLKELNSKLDKNIVHERTITDRGEAIRVHHLSDIEVVEFKNSEYYKYSTSIVDKLSPIVELIKESEIGIESLIKE